MQIGRQLMGFFAKVILSFWVRKAMITKRKSNRRKK